MSLNSVYLEEQLALIAKTGDEQKQTIKASVRSLKVNVMFRLYNTVDTEVFIYMYFIFKHRFFMKPE